MGLAAALFESDLIGLAVKEGPDKVDQCDHSQFLPSRSVTNPILAENISNCAS